MRAMTTTTMTVKRGEMGTVSYALWRGLFGAFFRWRRPRKHACCIRGKKKG
jgi:hypothetical protein